MGGNSTLAHAHLQYCNMATLLPATGQHCCRLLYGRKKRTEKLGWRHSWSPNFVNRTWSRPEKRIENGFFEIEIIARSVFKNITHTHRGKE